MQGGRLNLGRTSHYRFACGAAMPIASLPRGGQGGRADVLRARLEAASRKPIGAEPNTLRSRSRGQAGTLADGDDTAAWDEKG
jgi:hypothetical protein